MDQPGPGQASAMQQEASAALARGQIQRASELLARVPQPWDAATIRLGAQIELAGHRWERAQAYLEKLDPIDDSTQVRLNLARNLGLIQRVRPHLYETLHQPAAGGRYQLVRTPGGRLAIAQSGGAGGQPVLVNTAADPAGQARRNLAEMAGAMAEGKAPGVMGIGDGHLLAAMAQVPPRLFMDQALAVHLFEPEAELVLHCLMMHDFTGAAGPILDERFQWFVGPQWQAKFERAICHEQTFLPPPQLLVSQGKAKPGIAEGIAASNRTIASHEQQLRRRVRQYYDRVSDEELAAAFSDRPGRRPRVVVLTSRFTTVLRFSAAEAAEAFESMGWETHLIMEPRRHERLLMPGILETLDRVKPDLFFTLDHVRSEQGETFPPGLPYVCWVQDLMPNLTSAAAGMRVGRRDFVMSFATPLLVETYRYPERQCIDVPMMMARKIERPERWESDGPDLAYVSHLSSTAEVMRKGVVDQAPAAAKEFVERCCDGIIGAYARGGMVASMYDVGAVVDGVTEEMSADVLPGFRKALIELLWNPLNIALYRQQALTWVAKAAREMNLTLAIYGQGWENHPEFGQFARGTIEQGRPLENLVRSARINLNLEPYPCTTHNRLLNGLAAGGFYLVREHPANVLLPELANFLDKHAGRDCATAEAALRAVPRNLRGKLEELLRRAAGVSFTQPPEPVRQLRCYERAGVVAPGSDQLLPGLDQVSFRDAESCRRLIERFVGDAEGRRAIAEAQRASIEKRLSVHHGIDRVVRWIGGLLVENRGAVAAVPA